MRIGFYGESPADQAAMGVFTEGIIGEPPERISMDLAADGVGRVLSTLRDVLIAVHYNSDAEGLVVVVDADDTDLHDSTHDFMSAENDGCRLCKCLKIIAKARNRVKPRQGRPELQIAVGLAVPSIEAWYLAGKNHQVGEAAWKTGLASGRLPFTRPQLKELVYGTNRPSIELETERATAEARRIIADMKAIESASPAGFGLMAEQIRTWKAK
jgi:hypothetical protein